MAEMSRATDWLLSDERKAASVTSSRSRSRDRTTWIGRLLPAAHGAFRPFLRVLAIGDI